MVRVDFPFPTKSNSLPEFHDSLRNDGTGGWRGRINSPAMQNKEDSGALWHRAGEMQMSMPCGCSWYIYQCDPPRHSPGEVEDGKLPPLFSPCHIGHLHHDALLCEICVCLSREGMVRLHLLGSRSLPALPWDSLPVVLGKPGNASSYLGKNYLLEDDVPKASTKLKTCFTLLCALRGCQMKWFHFILQANLGNDPLKTLNW